MVNVRDKRLASCQGKQRFSSFRRARQIARLQAQRRHEALSPYPCHFCGGFHIGTHLGQDGDVGSGAPDSRQRYAVFAVKGKGPDTLVGFSNAPGGGGIAEIIKKEGWTVTRIIPRWRKSK